MTRENMFPRVFEPQSIVEFSTLCYQAIYEGNEEAKKYLKLVELNYCSPLSTLEDNEKAYMLTYVNTGFHLAKKMKDIERRRYCRIQRLKEKKEEKIKDAYNRRKNNLKKAEDIFKNNSKKNEEIKNEEIEEIKDRQSIWNKIAEVAPPSVSSLLIGLNYLPPLAAAGVSGFVAITTYSISKIYRSKKRDKKKEILNDYYDENGIIFYNLREQQQIIDNEYSLRIQEIKNEWEEELKKIEKNVDQQKKKHFDREEKKLARVYERFINKAEVPKMKAILI